MICGLGSLFSTFRRSKEDEHPKLFRDVVEAMLHLCGNKEHAPSRNFGIFISRPKASAAPQDVIHFILLMRPLQIVPASREHVEA